MKPVTFFRKLRQLAKAKPFRLVAEATDPLDGSPRAQHLIRQKRTLRCPICAVCAAETGNKYEDQEYGLAAHVLGLDATFAASVAFSADGTVSPFSTIPNIRPKLLRAVGLSEAKK